VKASESLPTVSAPKAGITAPKTSAAAPKAGGLADLGKTTQDGLK